MGGGCFGVFNKFPKSFGIFKSELRQWFLLLENEGCL